jgi:ketosteroid isomerase-like protein
MAAPRSDDCDPSPDDHEAVEAANDRFYAALEADDFGAMSDLWLHDHRVSCTHPGWVRLRGWNRVGASWAAIAGGPQRLQFILTDLRIDVLGDTGIVTVDENMVSEGFSSTAAAVNLFIRTTDGWRMLAHHASPVAPGAPGVGAGEAAS